MARRRELGSAATPSNPPSTVASVRGGNCRYAAFLFQPKGKTMKASYDGRIFRIEPLTSDQEEALKRLLHEHGCTEVAKGDWRPATHLRHSDQTQNTACEAV